MKNLLLSLAFIMILFGDSQRCYAGINSSRKAIPEDENFARYLHQTITITAKDLRQGNPDRQMLRNVDLVPFRTFRTPLPDQMEKVRESLSNPALLEKRTVRSTLVLPDKEKYPSKRPLVIVSPGSEGAEHLSFAVWDFFDSIMANQGIAYLIVNHFNDELFEDQFRVSLESMLIDVFEIGKNIVSSPDTFSEIDTNNIGILGISRGGIVADCASRVEFQKALNLSL